MSKFAGEKMLLRIFVGESKKHGHRPLYEALMELFLNEGFAGATVLKGVAGFGAHRVYHTHKLLELSADMPMVIEAVESRERIDAVMPRIEAMLASGMITLEKVTVVRYTHEHDAD